MGSTRGTSRPIDATRWLRLTLPSRKTPRPSPPKYPPAPRRLPPPPIPRPHARRRRRRRTSGREFPRRRGSRNRSRRARPAMRLPFLQSLRLSHRNQAASFAPRGHFDPIGDQREYQPAGMKKDSSRDDKAAGDWTDRGAVPDVREGDQRRGMDGELAVI